MYAIRNFTNTKCELEMAKTRLNLLMDRKEKLYCKYFPITAKAKEVMVDGGYRNNDKMADYIHELHEVDIGTGKSLAEEITYQQQIVDNLQGYLNNMADSLSKMTGIEYQLFYEIVYKGVKITKAVENIATANGIEPQTIWKNYYKKIKKYVNRVIVFGYDNQI
jgi:lambda repressor-like predicted transcriptional regulator